MVFYDLLKPWATRLNAANQLKQFKGFTVLVGLAIALPSGGLTAPGAIAQTGPAACSQPALARLTRHRVAQGETLTAIAQRYSLLPATIMGLNPAVQGGGRQPRARAADSALQWDSGQRCSGPNLAAGRPSL